MPDVTILRNFTVRLKNGLATKICVNCAKELQAKRSQQQPVAPATEKSAPVPMPVPVAKNAKSSDDKWYKTMGFGILCILLAGFIYYQLTQLEAGAVSSVRVWWPVAALYNTVGFWGVVSCSSILAVLFLGLEVKQLDQENATG